MQSFFIDWMQSFLFLSNANFFISWIQSILLIQFNVFDLFNAIFFINVMQPSFMWLLQLNSKAPEEHLTI